MIELNSPKLRVTFSDLGARIVSVFVDGVDVVAGGGNDEQFLAGDWTAGAVMGRIAGRISHARFTLDGVEYRLVPNMGEHQLHGGLDNFGNRRWSAEQQGASVRFAIHSPDGDQGYPGAVDASATYTLSGGTLALDLVARTTRPTVVNLTNHAYWNLTGGTANAFAHDVQIDAGAYLPLSDLLLPTGEVAEVGGTRWDFRKPRLIGEDYDNYWVVDGARGDLRHALTLRDPASGRRMEVWATEAGVQMYTAWHWNEAMPGRRGPLRQFAAIAIEPQNFPDAPRHANFPSAVLRPGELYRNRIEWRFG